MKNPLKIILFSALILSLIGSCTRAKKNTNLTVTSKSATQEGLSFNTYNWKYESYMVQLRKRIEDNIKPPEDFIKGYITGETLLRFKIYRDGKMKDL